MALKSLRLGRACLPLCCVGSLALLSAGAAAQQSSNDNNTQPAAAQEKAGASKLGATAHPAPSTQPASPAKVPATKAEAAAEYDARIKAQSESGAKPTPVNPAGAAGDITTSEDGKKEAPEFEMNPDAKWSCEQDTVSQDAVWRNDQTLTFPFKIHNEGTADLLIRAKGG